MYSSTHIFVYAFIGMFNPSLIQVFIPLLICALTHVITVPRRELSEAPTLAAGSEARLSPTGRHSQAEAGLRSLKLRPIFPTLQIKWVLTESLRQEARFSNSPNICLVNK